MILVEEGQSPLLLCLPHSGTDVPGVVLGQFNATGRLQADLSWRLEQVFDFGDDLDATVLRSTTSRYVIDLDQSNEAEPGNETTPTEASCPLKTLDGKAIYKEGEEPGPVETEQRSLLFYEPFHLRLRQQIDRLLRLHEKVFLLDCQSMRSNIQGVTGKGLPLVSIGSALGQSCDPDLRNLFVGSFKGQTGFTVGVDEQTAGGFITRTYGRPDLGVHALTLLLAQRSYLRHESPPFEPDKTRVTRLKAVLADSLTRVLDWTGMEGVTTDGAHVAEADGAAELEEEPDKATDETPLVATDETPEYSSDEQSTPAVEDEAGDSADRAEAVEASDIDTSEEPLEEAEADASTETTEETEPETGTSDEKQAETSEEAKTKNGDTSPLLVAE